MKNSTIQTYSYQSPLPSPTSTARPNFNSPGEEFTTSPIQAGKTDGLVPEFGRFKTATNLTGLSRSKLYQGINEGWVRSVSMRKKGQKFSVRLIHLPSLIQVLRTKMEEQNGIETQQDNPVVPAKPKAE